MRLYIFFSLLIVIAISAACSSSEKVNREDDNTPREVSSEIPESNIEELQQKLTRTRSKLSDVYLSQQHDIPEAFLKKDTTSNTVKNPFDGYRIQIHSSRDVDLADSVTTQFRIWADTTFTDYVPKAYVFFKQPYFKVHVGDFQNRDKANTLSQIIKKQYPDAWVVHDRIDPQSIPGDTTNIEIAKQNSDKENGKEQPQ